MVCPEFYTPRDTDRQQDPSSNTTAPGALTRPLLRVPLLAGVGFTLVLLGTRSLGSRVFTEGLAWGWVHLWVPRLQSPLSGAHLWDLDPLTPCNLHTVTLQGRNCQDLPQPLHSPCSSSHSLFQPCSLHLHDSAQSIPST